MCKFRARVTCAFMALAATALWAQSLGGTLSGRVVSADGAAVPNAAITIINVNTNASQKSVAGSDGTFSVSGLPPGTYRVEVEMAGFKRTSQQNIELTATGPATLNITLEAGDANSTVQIQGTASLTQGDNGEISIAIGSHHNREFPVIDRNHHELVGLQSGVAPPVRALDFVIDPDRNRFFTLMDKCRISINGT